MLNQTVTVNLKDGPSQPLPTTDFNSHHETPAAAQHGANHKTAAVLEAGSDSDPRRKPDNKMTF